MNSRRELSWSLMVLLMAVVTVLALAEQIWWYWLTAFVACLIGGWRIATGRRALFGNRVAVVWVVAAFGLMVFEFFFGAIRLIALSHFMILVCVCKVLQQRTLRDEAQMLMLLFSMLIIAAVVSGSVVFLPTLFLFFTLGVYVLIRFHLYWEQQSCGVRQGILQTPVGQRIVGFGDRRGDYYPVIGGTLACAMIVGVVIFVFCPRLGGSMLPRMSDSGGTQAVTGIDRTFRLHPGGSIKESSLPVFRVQFQVGDRPPRPVNEGRLYFRCGTADHYILAHHDGEYYKSWEWVNHRDFSSMEFSMSETGLAAGYVCVLPNYWIDMSQPVLIQHYWLESRPATGLPMFYPAVGVKSGDFETLHKDLYGQVFRVDGPASKTALRYSVLSPRILSDDLIEKLAQERGERSAITVDVTSSLLPRTGEIKALVRRVTDNIGSLDQPQQRLEFARRIEEFLKSKEFKYTLSPPRISSGREPIGEFLLEHRQGHCEYFASAMTLMCQLSGVPARLVSGYKGGDYNSLGKFYIVREKHAHAWVEVYVPGMDWVRFDPTPPGGQITKRENGFLAGMNKYLDFVQFYWASQVMSYDDTSRRELLAGFQEWLLRPTRDEKTIIGAVAAFINELFGGELVMTFKERMIYWVFSLLVLAIVVMVSYALVLIARHLADWFTRFYHARRHGWHRPPEAEFYYRFCRLLAEAGWKRSPDQTPAEYADWLTGQSEHFYQAPEIVHAYYALVFGGRRLSPDQRSRIEHYMQSLRQTLPSLSKK